MSWAALLTAIVCEVAATLSIRPAVNGRPAMFGIVIAGYLLAFAGLAVALSEGMGLGVAYGIWAATGVAATALLSKVIFGEPLTWTMVAGLGLIMGGVLLVELGAH